MKLCFLASLALGQDIYGATDNVVQFTVQCNSLLEYPAFSLYS